MKRHHFAEEVRLPFARRGSCYIHFTIVAVFWFMIFVNYADGYFMRSWDTTIIYCLRLELDSEFERRLLIGC